MSSRDTAAGVIVGSAFGDALGAGYEFEIRRLPTEGPCQMIGGGLGNFAPGEWTDDTSMATALVDAAADFGTKIATRPGLNHIATGFARWYATGPADVGMHTRLVLSAVMGGYRNGDTDTIAAAMSAAASRRPPRAPQQVSNGAVMRTAPAVVPWIGTDDPADVAACGAAAGRIAALTHAEATAVMSTAAWSGLLLLAAAGHDSAPTSAQMKDAMVTAAAGSARDQRRDPAFGTDTLTAITWYATGERIEPWVQQWSNSSALGCIRDALASVYPHWLADPTGHEPDRFFAAVDAAVKCGGDADTVAAVAGGLAGAIWGLDAIPNQDILHGYPGWTVADLTTRSDRAVGHSTAR